MTDVIRSDVVLTGPSDNLLPGYVTSLAVVNATPNSICFLVNEAYHSVPGPSVTTVFAGSPEIFLLQLIPNVVPMPVTVYSLADGVLAVDFGLPQVVYKYGPGELTRCPNIPYGSGNGSGGPCTGRPANPCV